VSKPKHALPDALELAKLAALIPRSEIQSQADRVRIAAEIYVEAVILREECASFSLEELIARYRNKRQAAIARFEARWQDRLELDPAKESDPVRDYLAARGLPLKTARKTLEHVRAVWKQIPAGRPPYWEFDAEIRKNSGPYFIPRWLLDEVVGSNKSKQRRAVQKSKARPRRRKAVK
jgi:hypothetical protein